MGGVVPCPGMRSALVVLLALTAVGCAAGPAAERGEAASDAVQVLNRTGEPLIVRALSAASYAAGFDFGDSVPAGVPTRTANGEERPVPVTRVRGAPGDDVVLGLFRLAGRGEAVLIGRVEADRSVSPVALTSAEARR